MAKKYLTCAETAKLVREALKEAFRGMKFSVRSSTYSGGASISISWIDGPNVAQVETVTDVFHGSYFDGSIDYKGNVYHMINGEQVSMGADFIFTSREFSDKAVQGAIGRIMRKFAGNFREDGIAAPSVEDYRKGLLWNVRLSALHCCGSESVQTEINKALHHHTFQPRTDASKTAGKVMVLGDDGYSRACGGGFSAVAVDDFHIPAPGQGPQSTEGRA